MGIFVRIAMIWYDMIWYDWLSWFVGIANLASTSYYTYCEGLLGLKAFTMSEQIFQSKPPRLFSYLNINNFGGIDRKIFTDILKAIRPINSFLITLTSLFELQFPDVLNSIIMPTNFPRYLQIIWINCKVRLHMYVKCTYQQVMLHQV